MRRLRTDEPVREVPPATAAVEPKPVSDTDRSAFRRERLLAALTLIMGTGLVLATPFALREGAEFFMPVTAALVIAIALVPMLEWLERRGLPSGLSAFICVLVFVAVANVAVASIVVPASDWVRLIPERIGRIRATLQPLMHAYSQLQRFFDDIVRQFSTVRHPPRTVAVEPPNSLVDVLASSAPLAAIQM